MKRKRNRPDIAKLRYEVQLLRRELASGLIQISTEAKEYLKKEIEVIQKQLKMKKTIALSEIQEPKSEKKLSGWQRFWRALTGGLRGE